MLTSRRVFLGIFVVVIAALVWKYETLRRGTPIQYGSGEGPLIIPPSRDDVIERLSTEEFDMIVVGGGSTGAGTALDATSRGLRVALLEMDDWGAGTSSRSTKLLHGGVRYLRKALEKWDISQYSLVRDALSERATMFHQAPHLTRALPILTPLYSWRDVPFNWFLLKLYDYISFPKMHSSFFISADTAKKEFPQLRQKDLVGAVVYYDGQFDDARFNLALSLTCHREGVAALSHAQVIGVLHDGKNTSGVIVKDVVTGKEFQVKGNIVVNAAGHFADHIRLMDNPNAKPVLEAAAGTHIVLGKSFCPPDTGLLIPKTSDGRVLFMLPYQNHTLVGTTDSRTEITNNPRPAEADIVYLLKHVNEYFDTSLKRDDVISAWSGIRPLKKASEKSDTAQVSREHGVYISESGLMTIVGGKWTTYRKMSEDVVNKALAHKGMKEPHAPSTDKLKLIGAKEYQPGYVTPSMFSWMRADTAQHLNDAYGDQAVHVARLSEDENLKEQIHSRLPHLRGEIVWAVKFENAETPVDVLMRRLSFGVLDNDAAVESVDLVVELMGRVKHWNEKEKEEMRKETRDFFQISL
uniref:Glycerol-3-phosphate dehydrogenase n=1 Tax=Stygiella incarcerata TaxID=1712417 RepID=A0A192ZJ70_9EUKA|nr:glycerol-3-phosphate DH [Stygiella incarcerata]|eukprot:TRINITY_DN82204_c0_g1_i1.p1 TRINITY_DN82204_c0_g1~~TRINITY_DN82204_c0_g1_i1.p1  ORF type:complete len:580 (-),score=178.89 TRINITY_DN82204_c0_g1_i1:29-1768(-)